MTVLVNRGQNSEKVLDAKRGMGRGWVCLLYHNVSHDPQFGDGREHFSVSISGFQRQLDLIQRVGRHGSSLEHALTALGRWVAISFDDGDVGQYKNGFDALTRRGMSATFFVTTDWIGRAGFVSWEHLREMKAAGMSIQSHTKSHPFLSELDRIRVREELRASKQELDQRLGQETTSVALPNGAFPSARFRDEIISAGYSVVATSRWGTNLPLACDIMTSIHRCTVRGDPTDDMFIKIISGDRLLAHRRRLRESVLAVTRATLGPKRYARWRRRILSGLGGAGS